MVTAGDFRNGLTFDMDGSVMQIIEFQHVKPGKGAAFVRTKLRNVISGAVVEKTFNPTDKYPVALVERKEMQYLYNDGSDFYFMDPVSFDQISLPADHVGDTAQWLKENDTATLEYADGELLGVEPKMFVELEVTETEPGFKGDTVQGSTKPATLETGAEVKVPMFVEVGDVLQIDTRDGRVIKRV